MSSRTRAFPLHIASPLALAIGLAFAGGAQAQESTPWYVGVSQGFTHDSNIYRAADATVADTISSTGLLGGLNLDLGRQHLFADATANMNRFNKIKELNNTSYSLSSGLNWQTVEHLSGALTFVGRRDLDQLTVQGEDNTTKNIETLQQATASVRYGFASHLGIEGGAERRTLKDTVRTERNLTERIGNLGLRWGTPGSLLVLGVGGRVTKGDAPLYRAYLLPSFPIFGLGPVTPDSYDRKDIDFTANWTPTSISTVSARVSLTRENHSAPTRPDFSGLTGAVSWDYRPGGRFALKTTLTRDTGSQQIFTTPSQSLVFEQVNSSRLTNVLTLDAKYELTAKIVLTGTVLYNSGSYVDSAGSSSTSASNKVSLGAQYQATRTISLACNASRDSHKGYGDNIAGCSAQFVLR